MSLTTVWRPGMLVRPRTRYDLNSLAGWQLARVVEVRTAVRAGHQSLYLTPLVPANFCFVGRDSAFHSYDWYVEPVSEEQAAYLLLGVTV